MPSEKLKNFMENGSHAVFLRMVGTWIDNYHMGTGILFAEAAGDTFNATGHYPTGDQVWRWRTTLGMPSDNELVITAYNIEPGAEEVLAVKIRYDRV